jgi:hypothetical protein
VNEIDLPREATRRAFVGLLGIVLESTVAIAAAEAGPGRAPRRGHIRQKYDGPSSAYHSRRRPGRRRHRRPESYHVPIGDPLI